MRNSDLKGRLLRALGLSAMSGLMLSALLGCGAVQSSGSSASGTRTSPSASPAVPSPSGQNVYADPFDHYSVSYPANWFVHPSSQAGGTTSISNYDLKAWKPGRWKLDIIPTQNPQGLTARQWADMETTSTGRPNSCSATIIRDTAVTVGGEAGLERDESDCRGSGIGIYVRHGGRMFVFLATDQPAFQSTLASILASFTFTQ